MIPYRNFHTILVITLILATCGTDQYQTSENQIITNDMTDTQTREFNQQVAGTWANNVNDDFIEGYSFTPGSTGLSGTMGQFVSDASGEIPYELISKRKFEKDNQQWVGWIIQNQYFNGSSAYLIVCHEYTVKPEEIHLYPYFPYSVDNCFAPESKQLKPYEIE